MGGEGAAAAACTSGRGSTAAANDDDEMGVDVDEFPQTEQYFRCYLEKQCAVNYCKAFLDDLVSNVGIFCFCTISPAHVQPIDFERKTTEVKVEPEPTRINLVVKEQKRGDDPFQDETRHSA